VLFSITIGSINITMLAPYSIEFTRAAAAAASLFKLIDRDSAINPFDKSGEQPSEITGLVELDNVTFAYPTRPGITVLDGFSLRIPAGKVTALVVSSQYAWQWIIRATEADPTRDKAAPVRAPLSA
jgi:ATP-binding cassette subfamily B (MDR/TAP) protein 1